MHATNMRESLLRRLGNVFRARAQNRRTGRVDAFDIWLDVGAHLGETTFKSARANSFIKVYAFEPNLRLAVQLSGKLPNYIVIPMAVAEQDGCAEFFLNSFDAASSLLPFDTEGLGHWVGREQLQVIGKVNVPTIRLDTFMDLVGISRVQYLKVDAQGADFAVIRSAGARLRCIEKIELEVAVTPRQLYQGAASKAEIIDYMERAGFVLVRTTPQSSGQEENLTFAQAPRG